jgi:L-rhamnose mutarotase
MATLQRVAFKMKLIRGYEDEYRKRHNAIWPQLQNLLKEKSIEEYSIFLDADTNDLFGYFKVSDRESLDSLPHHPVMKKWWEFMKDIMITNEDHSPLTIPLQEVFYLP